jgi:ureidoacrylate peracid hydrolase
MPQVKIEPKETALLLIDMENDVLHEKGKGASLGVWKFAEEAETIRNTKKMVDTAKKNNIPVIYVRIAFRPDYVDVGLVQSPLWKLIKEGEVFKEGTWGANIVDELKPEADDYIVTKRRLDAFYNTELETLLRGLDRRTLIICGIVTNFCVEGTVRGAADRDFNVIVLSDCTASENKEMQEFPMEKVFPMIATVTTSEELII